MNLNSFSYILLFLPTVMLLRHLASRLPFAKAPQVCVLMASLFFYAWPKPSNLVYLFGSILANWMIGRWIGGTAGRQRKRILQLGLVLNILFLSVFKYLGFFMGSVAWLIHRHSQVPDLAFPLGISFFTVTQIIYLVDCYEEMTKPSDLFDHLTFISFFPYVVSGPISRAKRILHQFPLLNGRSGPAADMVARAMFLFSLGLIKKVVLADCFAKPAEYGFSNIGSLSSLEALVFAFSYALQVYFDFSGYSDMAIASALLLGIEIPRNFDAPLRATSIIDFWQRWHISLTSFITTYVYTPILRSFRRVTLFKSAIATMLAMTVAGLWHGANWTFVVFGIIMGVGLAVNQYWRKKKMPKISKLAGWLMTITVFILACIFFRSPNLHTAFTYLGRIFSLRHPFGTENLHMMNGEGLMIGVFLLAQAIGIVAAFFGKSSEELSREFKPTWLNYAATAACTLIAFLYMNSNVAKPFVYFKF